ncbi:MAG: cyclic nucleotide-binding domain-containing protein [Anaerolineales bacterium]|nr:cyclic nucleotide-binding domain-containing protein [Anaerolineales bacterium]
MVSTEIISQVELFEGLPRRQLSKVAEFFEEESYSRGALIFNEGDPAECLYVLLEGKVAIRLHLSSRPESVTVAMLEQTYETFGWSSLVAPYYYTASALCEDNCKVLSISGLDLIGILEQEPASGFEVMRKITEVIGSRLRNSRMVLLKSL